MVSAVGHIYSPAADNSKRRAIVSCTSANKVRQALNIKDKRITAVNGSDDDHGKSTMEFDDSMHEMGILYEPLAQQGVPNLEYV